MVYNITIVIINIDFLKGYKMGRLISGEKDNPGFWFREDETSSNYSYNIFTFELRKNLKHGRAKHLQCPLAKSETSWFMTMWIVFVIVGSLLLSK